MSDMETRVRELEIDAAKREMQVEFLVKVVESNTAAITELTTVLNKGKGAAWAMAGVYTLFGGLIATAISWFKS
jgi:hypothetical protein